MVDSSKDGAKARAAYDAQAEALRVRTEKLRALRLAKEEADRKAAPPSSQPASRPGGATKRVKAQPKQKQSPAKLSEWLASQQNQGRRS